VHLLFSIERTLYVPFAVIIVDVIYILFRFHGKIHSFSLTHHKPILLIFFLLLYNSFNGLLQEGRFEFYLLGLVVVSSLLVFILDQHVYNIQNCRIPFRESVMLLSKGYIWLAMISILGVILSFVLLRIGLVHGSPLSLDFFETNEYYSSVVYLRTFVSVTQAPINALGYYREIRVPFFQDYGVLCGLFHEPHILAYHIFPCVIFLIGIAKSVKQRVLFIILSILMILFAGSATNFIVIVACLSVYFILLARKNAYFAVLGLLLVLVLVGGYFILDDTFLQFVLNRLDSGNISNMSTKELLAFAFSPKTLMGTNFLSTSFTTEAGGAGGQDIGLIAFIFNIWFLVLYFRNTIKLLFKHDRVSVSVGFMCLYYILHSAKIGMNMYIQIMPVFLVYLQNYVLKYGRIQTTNRIRAERIKS